MQQLRFASLLSSTSLYLATSVLSQGPAAPAPEHAALHSLVGTWQCTAIMKTPQGDSRATAVETSKPVCNGLWLQSTVHGTWQGRPFQMVWLRGFHPADKHYVSIYANSTEATASITHDTFDAKTRSWTSSRIQGTGASRSQLVWKDDDTSIETSYATGADGEETVVMELTRSRVRIPTETEVSQPASTNSTVPQGNAAPQTAVVAPAAPIDPIRSELLKHVGAWDLVMHMPSPDGQINEETGTEEVSAACDGKWLWSNFTATMMGSPFTGHALVGYDPTTRAVTTYWIDSMTPYLTTLVGTCDPKAHTLTGRGKSRDAEGNAADMTERVIWKGDNSRVSRMTITSPQGTMAWDMSFTRAHRVPDHKLPEIPAGPQPAPGKPASGSGR